MRDFFDFIKEVVLPITAIVVIGFGVVVGLVLAASSHECSSKTALMNIEAQWGVFTGCMLNIQGQWLPWSEVVPVERDGKIVFAPKPQIRINEVK